MDDFDKQLLALIQTEVPIVARPFARIGEQLVKRRSGRTSRRSKRAASFASPTSATRLGFEFFCDGVLPIC